jgi:hypothetical protein
MSVTEAARVAAVTAASTASARSIGCSVIGSVFFSTMSIASLDSHSSISEHLIYGRNILIK